MTTEAESLLKTEQSLEEKKEDFHFTMVGVKKGKISPKDQEFAEKTLRNLLKKLNLKSAFVLHHQQ